MITSIKELIKQRKSIRTYSEKPLSDEDLNRLEEYLVRLTNPFNVPVTFRLLKAKEHELSSPVIVGAKYYIAAKVEKVLDFEIAYGS